MSIKLTDELEAKTKKGKLASAKQIYLEGDQENLQQIGDKTHQLENAIKDISVSGGASTANAVSYNNGASGITAITAQGAIDELTAKDKAQDTEIAKKANSADVTSQMQTERTRVNAELAKKFDKTSIVQETGDGENVAMSQKAVKNAINEVTTNSFFYDCSRNSVIKHKDLADAISSVPKEFQQGGLTIKFNIEESYNAQIYTLKLRSWNTDISNWEPSVRLIRGVNVDFNPEYTDLDATNVQVAINKMLRYGYSFKGIATPDTDPGNPLSNCFYLASAQGVYTHFNNYNIKNSNEIVVFKFDNAVLSVQQLASEILSFNDIERYYYNFHIGNGGILYPIVGSFFNYTHINYEGHYNKWKVYIIPLYAKESIKVTGLSSRSNIINFAVLKDLHILKGTGELIQNKSIVSKHVDSDQHEYTAEENCFCICTTSDVDNFTCKIKTYGVFGENEWQDIKTSKDILFSTDLLQSSGTSTTRAMSQKAVTDCINTAIKNITHTEVDLTPYAKKTDILKGFEGETVVGIGDSLSQSGFYEKDFCDISGATYIGVFSKGGSTSFSPVAKDGTMDRVNQFLESGKDASIIFLENVNDKWLATENWDGASHSFIKKGSIKDDSFMVSSYYDYSKIYYNNELAKQDFTENLQSIALSVPASQRKNGLILRQVVKTKMFKFQVTKKASKAGSIVITIGNNSKSVTVSEDDTLETIAYNINQYSYDGFTHNLDASDKTTVCITMYDSSEVPSNAGVNVGDTGVEVSVSSEETSTYRTSCFLGHSEVDILNIDNWGSVNLYQVYKGIIEKIQSEKPTSRIVWLMPNIWSLKYNPKDSEYTNADGTFNMYKIKDSVYNCRYWALFDIQREVCEYYGIEYVELYKKDGITPYNIETYYYSDNIHPKRLTYTKWANIIYRALK